MPVPSDDQIAADANYVAQSDPRRNGRDVRSAGRGTATSHERRWMGDHARAIILLGRSDLVHDMSKVDLRNIEKVPGRCGGRAAVAGTRIRVSVLVWCHRHGMTVEEILRQYPRLRTADVYDALAYAADHPAEIEADLAANDEAAVQQALSDGASAP
jgi:uncharacterized protein (DUF433 family)